MFYGVVLSSRFYPSLVSACPSTFVPISIIERSVLILLCKKVKPLAGHEVASVF